MALRRMAIVLLVAAAIAGVAFGLSGSQTVPRLYAAQAPAFIDGVWHPEADLHPHARTRRMLSLALVALVAVLCVPFVPFGETRPAIRSPQFTALVLLVFVPLLALFWDFVVDDAYITFRFGQQLARGNGIVWNVGEAPLEGSTSFLWVLLSAGAELFHVDPAAAAKLCGVAAACGAVGILARRAAALPWGLQLVFAGGLAFSPAFAFHAVHGMETALSALLVLVTAQACLAVLERGSRAAMLAAGAGALLSFAARPDTAACTTVCLLGSGIVLLARGERGALLAFAGRCAPSAVVWAGFMVWRRWYFGMWLPNTFQVKVAKGEAIFKSAGASYAWGSLLGLAAPFVALFIVALLVGVKRKKLVEATPLLAGVALFGVYLCTITPLQGFLARFALPVLPVLILAVACVLEGSSLAGGLAPRRARSALLAILFAAWGARQLEPALDLKEDRTQLDRVLVGRRLALTRGTMLASEAGAVPFYSGWTAEDTLGLVSAEIARDGLSVRFLARLNPDLILLSIHGSYRPLRAVDEYMRTTGFVPLAAVHKSRGMYHYYFVRHDAAQVDAIRAAVLAVPGLRYGDLSKLFEKGDSPR